MTQAPHTICILGAGFGGLYTALALAQQRWSGPRPQILLVDPGTQFLFSPLLYELLTGELEPWHIAPSFQALLKEAPVTFWQGRVQGVDLPYRQVWLEDGRGITYDQLVLAVGQGMAIAGVPGVGEYAYGFRRLEECDRLHQRLLELEASGRSPVRVAIAGAGPSGVELAGKLADRLGDRGQILLFDRGDRLLKEFPGALQRAAAQALAQRRVRVSLQTSICEVRPDAVLIERHGQTQDIPVDLVVWTGGKASHDWVQALPCAKNDQGQVRTRPTLQLLDHPEVFALGDVADIALPQRQRVPDTAQAAYQQAPIAAHNLRARVQGRSLRAFRFRPLGDMMTVGYQSAVVHSFGLTLTGRLAAVVRQWAYLLRLPTARHRGQVARSWLTTPRRPRQRLRRRRPASEQRPGSLPSQAAQTRSAPYASSRRDP